MSANQRVQEIPPISHAGDAPEELIPALGGDRARVDGVDADAVAAVLLGQGHRHGEVRRVGRARVQLDPESGRRAPGRGPRPAPPCRAPLRASPRSTRGRASPQYLAEAPTGRIVKTTGDGRPAHRGPAQGRGQVLTEEGTPRSTGGRHVGPKCASFLGLGPTRPGARRLLWLLAMATAARPRSSDQRRTPEQTSLYRAVQEHLDTFLAQAESAGARVPAFVTREFDDSLKCGILSHGFAPAQMSRVRGRIADRVFLKTAGLLPQRRRSPHGGNGGASG